MLTLAALALAATSPQAPPTLVATAPWWERVTRTLTSDGTEQSCRYESSLGKISSPTCEVARSDKSGEFDGQFTKLTYERRFVPGGRPDMGKLQPGDTLLGKQVMMFAISAEGSVEGCKVLVSSGDSLPDYSCNEVRAEKFEASLSSDTEPARWAFMTILVYGHQEQVV